MSNEVTVSLPTELASRNPVLDAGKAPSGVALATFISLKSPRYADLAEQIPGLKEPDVVLLQPDPYPPVKVSPLVFHLLDAKQYGVESDDDGNLLSVVIGRPEFGDNQHKETVEAALLIYHGDKIVPARMSFRTTKCNAVLTASRALEKAQTAEWATLSPDHALSLKAPLPCLRFTSTVTVTQRTGRSKGRKYWLANSKTRPTTGAQLLQLDAAFKTPAFRDAVEAVLSSFGRRTQELDNLANGVQ